MNIQDVTSEQFGAEYSRELNSTRDLIFKSGDEVDVEYARSIFSSRFNLRAIEIIDSPQQIPCQVKGSVDRHYLPGLDLCTRLEYRTYTNTYSFTKSITTSSFSNGHVSSVLWDYIYNIIPAVEIWQVLLVDFVIFDLHKRVQNIGINFSTVGYDLENSLLEYSGEGISTWSNMSLLDRSIEFSFHKAATNLGLNVTTKKTPRKSKTAQYLQNVGALYTIVTNDVIYIVRRPSSSFFDNNSLHNDQGPALQWRDGSKMFVLHNMLFEEELYWKTVNHELSLEEINNIRNSDQRAIVWRMMDPKELLESSKATLVHTGIKGTDLYRISKLPTTGRVGYCMLMTCPSTSRQFLEWVNPDIGRKKDADLCQANAWGITKKQYLAMVAEG